MLITIADVLTTEQVAAARQKLAAAEWTDGRVTAGYQAQEVKRNAQIAEGSPVAREVGDLVLAGLARSPLFMSAALPLRVFPPMFNSYSVGQMFGTHVDAAIRQLATTGQRICTDVSATLFLTAATPGGPSFRAFGERGGVSRKTRPALDRTLKTIHQTVQSSEHLKAQPMTNFS